MIHFLPEPLSPDEALHLQRLQHAVDAKPTQKEKYQYAQNKWKHRKSGGTNKHIWQAIEQKLEAKHPVPGLCQYCEFDRNAATEHFFPKKHFPERAFSWDNFLRICYRCNTVKSDHFAVFDPAGSDHVKHLPDIRKSYPTPPTQDPVLINPRHDQPQDYLTLDLFTGIFSPTGISMRDIERAKYTIGLLELNVNANLLRYRRKALNTFLDKLDVYVKVKNATDFPDLNATLPSSVKAIVVKTPPFATEQARLLSLLKEDILNDLFPCAWREILSQKHLFPHIRTLIDAAPEVETW